MPVRRIGAAVVIALVARVSLLAADEATPSALHTAIERTPQAAIERTLSLVDVVLEHHIDPPTRQRMLVEGTREGASTLYLLASRPDSALSARRNSTVANREDAARFLSEVWTDVAVKSSSFDEMELNLQFSFFTAAAGSCRIMRTKDSDVEETVRANRYIGLGVTFSIDKESGLPQIRLVPNGPAAKAGALNNDLIESIDGEPAKELKGAEIFDRLRGLDGSQIALVLRQPGAKSRALTITRGNVFRRTVRGFKDDEESTLPGYQIRPKLPIAYLSIREIGGSTVHELRQIERQLRIDGIKALVIDLRRVARGGCHHAFLLADALLDGGVIGRVRTKGRIQEFTADRDCLFRGWPLVILVDENTRNTGEWVTAALQDNHRGVIIGNQTAGNVYVSGTVALADGEHSLELPTGVLERPSGKPLLRPAYVRLESFRAPLNDAREPAWGVLPDVMSSSPRNELIEMACDFLESKLKESDSRGKE